MPSKLRRVGGGTVYACVCTCVVGLSATQISPTPGSVANRVDALIGEGAVRDAVMLFDASADLTRTVDVALLQRLARAVLSQVAATSEDRAASLEACLALLAEGSDLCEPTVTLGAERSQSPVTRLRALARKLRTGSPQADRQLAQLTETFGPQDWNAVVDTAQEFPSPVAVRLLTRALAGGDEGARYGALVALAAIDDPSALPVLKRWASRTDTPGHLIALAAVARSGDAPALKEIGSLLPDLEGQDLLSAGVALASRNDPRGREALQQVLQGPEELLRVEAAAALAKLGDPVGLSRLEAELSNSNPWIRLRTLEKLSGVSKAPAPSVWRQMTDPMPWIRIRAAQATVAACRAQDATASQHR